MAELGILTEMGEVISSAQFYNQIGFANCFMNSFDSHIVLWISLGSFDAYCLMQSDWTRRKLNNGMGWV